MEEEKIRQKYTLLLILCTFIGTVIIMLGIYFWFIKKDDRPIENNQTINDKEETKKLYSIVDGDELELYDDEDGKLTKKPDISFDYPVINIDTAEIKKANEEIKKIYDDTKKGNLAKEVTSNPYGFMVKKGDKYYIEDVDADGILWDIKYNISEEENYLSISIIRNWLCHCGGATSVDKYVVDKKTNKLLSDSEIFKLFNVTEKEFMDYINSGDSCGATHKLSDGQLFIQDKKLAFAYEDCGGANISTYNK